MCNPKIRLRFENKRSNLIWVMKNGLRIVAVRVYFFTWCLIFAASYLLLPGCSSYTKGLTYLEPTIHSSDFPLAHYSFNWGAETQSVVYQCTFRSYNPLRQNLNISGDLQVKYDHNSNNARVTFTANKTTYFDFEYVYFDSFVVHTLIPPFKRPALYRALRQDFDLLMSLTQNMQKTYEKGDTLFHSAISYNDMVYYVVDKGMGQLHRIDIGSRGLKARLQPYPAMNDKVLPDSFRINLYNLHMDIISTQSRRKI